MNSPFFFSFTSFILKKFEDVLVVFPHAWIFGCSTVHAVRCQYCYSDALFAAYLPLPQESIHNETEELHFLH